MGDKAMAVSMNEVGGQSVRRVGIAGVLVSCALFALACSDDAKPEDPRWEFVFDDLDATAFSVWGSAEDDVWVVGADAGSGPLVLHYDGAAWQRLKPDVEGDLWWVSGRGDDVWMSGEAGLTLRYSRRDEQFEVFPVETTSVLYGVFPFAKDDVWAVGGSVEEARGELLHFDGKAWSPVADVPPGALEAPLFKVWGRDAEDVWVVGLGRVALHYDGAKWNRVDVPTGRRLLTVHGNDDGMTAVGGFASGLIVEGSPTKLLDRTPPDLPQLNGVWVAEDGSALAGGSAGALWRREGNKWSSVKEVPDTRLDYHSVFIDPSGGEWAVGGEVIAEPFDHGIVAHRGTQISEKLGD
ncbi:MAG: hypothetical protein RJA70_1113 [Pseudomonadota bacterium]|jgi:hypothetical protein